MRTQTKNKLVGILLILVLTACVFLTMTPIAHAEEPPIPELYEEGGVPEEATSEELPEVMPVSADEQVPTLYEDELEIVPIAIDEPVPELISEDAPVPELVSEDAPVPVQIAEQPQAASKTLPTWSWIVIIAASATALSLIAVGIVNGKRKKAAAK